jgi:hypothetical protein
VKKGNKDKRETPNKKEEIFGGKSSIKENIIHKQT